MSKVDPEQLKSALKLLMATLDRKRLQTLLMAGQGALLKTRDGVHMTCVQLGLNSEVSQPPVQHV